MEIHSFDIKGMMYSEATTFSMINSFTSHFVFILLWIKLFFLINQNVRAIYYIYCFIFRVCLFKLTQQLSSEIFWGHHLHMYSSSNKKRNTPIYFNKNYRTEMKLVPITMDYCVGCFRIFIKGLSIWRGGLYLTFIFSM